MEALVSLRKLRLMPGDPPLSQEVHQSDLWAIVSAQSEAVDALFGVISGKAEPLSGNAYSRGACSVIKKIPERLKLTAQEMAIEAVGKQNTERITEILTVCGLWDQRRIPYHELSPALKAAAQAMVLIASPGPVVCAPYTLDAVDPWRLESIIGHLIETRQSRALLLATQRPDIARRLEMVMIYDRCPLYVGTYSDLQREIGSTIVEVVDGQQSAVQALCDAFELECEVHPQGFSIKASPGQELAAKLLRDGYGQVKSIVQFTPELPEIVSRLSRCKRRSK